MKWNITGVLLLCGLLGGASVCWCGAPADGWNSVGVRAGLSATSKHDYFHQYEVYTSYGLPWSWWTGSGLGAAAQLNGALGALRAAEETGVIGSLGAGMVFRQRGIPVALDLGGDVALLSKHTFGEMDLNGNELFVAHVGLTYFLADGLGVSYRFQHMSNGGFGLHGDGNPGLDLHMLGLCWRFR